jgi:hypothetical protein
VLLLGHLHDNLLRPGVGVLGGNDLGNSGVVFSVLVTQQLLGMFLVLLGHGGDDLGDSGAMQ